MAKQVGKVEVSVLCRLFSHVADILLKSKMMIILALHNLTEIPVKKHETFLRLKEYFPTF